MQNIYNTKNCIYLGNVFHARFSPKQHKLNYKVFYLNINLKEINKKNTWNNINNKIIEIIDEN